MPEEKNMEIERKFLIGGFPQLTPVRTAVMEQGYLSTVPVVRIRKSVEENGDTRYVLCFKGKGGLVRKEIEMDIPEETYAELCGLLPMPPVRKEFRVYALADGSLLECNRVDPGEKGEFYYAEVEFPDVAAAHGFTPPVFLGREVTEQKGFSMKDYWSRKLAEKQVL